MKARTAAAVGALIVLGAATAIAQTPPTPAPPPPAEQPRSDPKPPPPPGPPNRPYDQGRGGPGGPDRAGFDGMFRGGPGGHMLAHGGPMPFPGKGASVRVDRDGGFTLKCADEDSTKACMDAANPVIERLLQARQSGR